MTLLPPTQCVMSIRVGSTICFWLENSAAPKPKGLSRRTWFRRLSIDRAAVLIYTMLAVSSCAVRASTALHRASSCPRQKTFRFCTWQLRSHEDSGRYTGTQDWKQANPTFDEIELDEEYYQSLGITEDELADQLSFLASDTDPEGQDLSSELSQASASRSSFLMDEEMDTDAWGPKVSAISSGQAQLHTEQGLSTCCECRQ